MAELNPSARNTAPFLGPPPAKAPGGKGYLGSSSGTRINGAQITSHLLKESDRISIGQTVWKFARQDELEAQLRDAQQLDAIGSLADGH